MVKWLIKIVFGFALVLSLMWNGGMMYWVTEYPYVPSSLYSLSSTVYSTNYSARSNPIKKMFWINLNASSPRAAHMKEFLNQYELKGERIAGVYPDQVPSQPDYRALVGNPNSTTDDYASPSSWASDFVHRRAYARIACEPGNDLFLIMEDDVVVAKAFRKKNWIKYVAECVMQAPSDWGILRLGITYPGGDEDRVGDTPWLQVGNKALKSQLTHSRVRYNGAHAIVLTPEKARILLTYIRKHKLIWADTWTGDSADGTVKSYALQNPVLIQNTKTYGSVRKELKLIDEMKQQEVDQLEQNHNSTLTTNSTARSPRTRRTHGVIQKPWHSGNANTS